MDDEWLVGAAVALGLPATPSTGIIVQDPCGTIIAANGAAESALGLTRDQLLGRTSADPRWVTVDAQGEIVAPESHPSMRVIRGQGPVVDFLMGVHRPTADAAGEHIWLTLTSVPAPPSATVPAGSALTLFQPVEQARSTLLRLQESERKYRLLAESSSDMVTWMAPDSTILWASPAAKSVLGYEPEELIGTRGLDLVHPSDLAHAESMRAAFTSQQATPSSAVIRQRHADGTWRWIESTGRAIRHHDAIVGLCTSRRDVTARVMAEQERDEAVEIFRLAMEHARVGMALLRDDDRMDRVNEAMCRVTGRSVEDLVGRRLSEITDDTELVVDGVASPAPDVEVTFQRPDGTTSWGLCAVTLLPSGATNVHALLQVQDVTAQHLERDRLAAAARTDYLTGLSNRVAVGDWLAGNRPEPLGGQIGVLYVDLDGFKRINDTWGHEVGDRLLQHVGRCLSAAVRKGDIVSRLGGDEFVVLCDDIAGPTLDVLAERVAAAIAQPVTIEGHTLTMTASVGARTGCSSDARSVLAHADHAMYSAKRAAARRREP